MKHIYVNICIYIYWINWTIYILHICIYIYSDIINETNEEDLIKDR